MNKNIYCSRKGGATIGGKFYPVRASDHYEKGLRSQGNKMAARARRRAMRLGR